MADIIKNEVPQSILCPLRHYDEDGNLVIFDGDVADLEIIWKINNGSKTSIEDLITLEYDSDFLSHLLEIPTVLITSFGTYKCIIKGSNIEPGYLDGLIVADTGYPKYCFDNLYTPTDIWNHFIEGNVSAIEAVRIILSAVSGITSKVGSIRRFLSVDGQKDRISASVDENGNRTNITLDGS